MASSIQYACSDIFDCVLSNAHRLLNNVESRLRDPGVSMAQKAAIVTALAIAALALVALMAGAVFATTFALLPCAGGMPLALFTLAALVLSEALWVPVFTGLIFTVAAIAGRLLPLHKPSSDESQLGTELKGL